MEKNFFKKKTLLFLFSFIFSYSCFAQDQPISWDISLQNKGDNIVELVAKASVKDGWHIYDTNLPAGGPNSTSLEVDKIEGAELLGDFRSVSKGVINEFDPAFKMNLRFFEHEAVFVQKIRIKDAGKFIFEGDVRAQACDATNCTPPLPESISFSGKDLPEGIKVGSSVASTTDSDSLRKSDNASSSSAAISANDSVQSFNSSQEYKSETWRPVIKELNEFAGNKGKTERSLLFIFIAGFLGGLIALFTPCVWPMIPMTVSFFLKRNKNNRKKAIGEAFTYGASIIAIYVLLGLLITLFFGASALNDLSTSALFNIIFFAILVIFAISFFGAFEMVLPASWSSKMDAKADKAAGLLSIFFMAFTLSLVSFSCTGPIIGTLLVEAATTNSILSPAIGMFGFALALSIPFSLFAIFPSWLQEMPKSGGWLNSVKVVLGFLELALAFKFLSVADLAYGWRILDREVFLACWIVIFLLLGLYLLGMIRFKHDTPQSYVSVPKLFMALISIAFAVYMIPGLWGAPLKSISAFSPPLQTQDFNLYKNEVHAKFDDYDAGMEYAKRMNKPVLIDFSGFGCVNCRKMEASVWTDPAVKNILENDYVLITLMVDDKTKLPQVLEVVEQGKKKKLKTVGDKWSYFQRSKFGSNSQPFYVEVDNAGKPLNSSYAFNENVKDYLTFLHKGLAEYKARKSN